MTEVHQYWTNRKVLVLVEAVAVALVEEVAVVAQEVVDLLDWEDSSRLECRS